MQLMMISVTSEAVLLFRRNFIWMLFLSCWKYEKAFRMMRMMTETRSTAQCTETSSSLVKLLR